MGLDELHLRVLSASSDNPTDKRNAQKGACLGDLFIDLAECINVETLVLKLMEKGRHWVLVVRYSNIRDLETVHVGDRCCS
jgi:metal transporter CNNM